MLRRYQHSTKKGISISKLPTMIAPGPAASSPSERSEEFLDRHSTDSSGDAGPGRVKMVR